MNVNVSIRIGSPGNDGPVTQTNVAVAVSAGVAAQGGQPPARAPSEAPAPAMEKTVGAVTIPSVAASIAAVIRWDADADAFGLSDLVGLPLAEEPEALPLRGLGLGYAAVPLADERTALPSRPGWSLPPIEQQVALVAGGRERDSTAAAPGAKAERDAERARPAPRWTRPEPVQREGAPAPPGPSAAASSGGSSSSGGLPIFLALPFLVAGLDLARRVARHRAASPSGLGDRVPETPG